MKYSSHICTPNENRGNCGAIVDRGQMSKSVDGGFTLIELLVVVAIIIALLAILMPAMNKALGVAEMAQCGSNERQIGIASIDYASSSFGRLPMGLDGPMSDLKTWDVFLLDHGLTPDLMLCPTQINQTRHYWANGNIHPTSSIQWSRNSSQTGVIAGWWSASLGEIPQPGTTIMFTEVRQRDAAFAIGGESAPGEGWGSLLWAYGDLFILQYSHMDYENVLFSDGHVQQMTEGDLLDGYGFGSSYTDFAYFLRVK